MGDIEAHQENCPILNPRMMNIINTSLNSLEKEITLINITNSEKEKNFLSFKKSVLMANIDITQGYLDYSEILGIYKMGSKQQIDHIQQIQSVQALENTVESLKNMILILHNDMRTGFANINQALEVNLHKLP